MARKTSKVIPQKLLGALLSAFGENTEDLKFISIHDAMKKRVSCIRLEVGNIIYILGHYTNTVTRESGSFIARYDMNVRNFNPTFTSVDDPLIKFKYMLTCGRQVKHQLVPELPLGVMVSALLAAPCKELALAISAGSLDALTNQRISFAKHAVNVLIDSEASHE